MEELVSKDAEPVSLIDSMVILDFGNEDLEGTEGKIEGMEKYF